MKKLCILSLCLACLLLSANASALTFHIEDPELYGRTRTYALGSGPSGDVTQNYLGANIDGEFSRTITSNIQSYAYDEIETEEGPVLTGEASAEAYLMHSIDAFSDSFKWSVVGEGQSSLWGSAIYAWIVISFEIRFEIYEPVYYSFHSNIPQTSEYTSVLNGENFGFGDGMLSAGQYYASVGYNVSSETFVDDTSPSFWANLTVSTSPIPEPSTMLLLGTGLIGLAGWGRRKFRKN